MTEPLGQLDHLLCCLADLTEVGPLQQPDPGRCGVGLLGQEEEVLLEVVEGSSLHWEAVGLIVQVEMEMIDTGIATQ